MLAILSISRNSRTLYGLPMLVPACLLGALGVALITPRWAAGVRVACAAGFGVALLAAWGFWTMQLFGWLPAKMWAQIQAQVPHYRPVFNSGVLLAALAATILWIWWMWRQPRAEPLTAVINWCSGLTLCYLIDMTLYLPLAKPTCPTGIWRRLRQFVANIHSPVMSRGLGEPQRAMFDYYCGLTTTRLEALLTPATIGSSRKPTPVAAGKGTAGCAVETGVGGTVHSRKELFRLYQSRRHDTAAKSP